MQHWNRYPERWQYLPPWGVSRLGQTKPWSPDWDRSWIRDFQKMSPSTITSDSTASPEIPCGIQASASLASPASLSWTRSPFGYQYCLLLLLSSQLGYSFPLFSRPPSPIDTSSSVSTQLFYSFSSPCIGKQTHSPLPAAAASLSGCLEPDIHMVKLYLRTSLVSCTPLYQSCSF